MKAVSSHLPFTDYWFVFSGGDTAKQNNHHGNLAQNFAYDFIKIGDNKQSHRRTGKKNTDYYAFGQKVLAPRKGEVVEIVNSIRDNKPGNINSYCLAGNYVMLRHDDGSVSLLAHFQKGSINVNEHDIVKAGDLLGFCGNSGYSSQPHIHYHVQDSEIYSKLSKKIVVESHAKAVKVIFDKIILQKDKHVLQNYSPVRGDVLANPYNTTKTQSRF